MQILMSLAQPRVYKGQEQYRDSHKDPLTGTARTLGMVLTERMNLTGLAMGLSGEEPWCKRRGRVGRAVGNVRYRRVMVVVVVAHRWKVGGDRGRAAYI